MDIKEFASKYLNITTPSIKKFPVFRKYNGELYQVGYQSEIPQLRKNKEYTELGTSEALYVIQCLYYFWGQLDSE